MASKMTGKGRQNFSEEAEGLLNKQINIELCSYQQYLALMAYYDRDTVSLKGFSNYFNCLASKKSERARLLVTYQNLRGGKALMCNISGPSTQEWPKPKEAIEFLINKEKQINEDLLNLRKVASTHSDAHLSHFLDDSLLKEQVNLMDELTRLYTNLDRVGDGLGVYILDKDLQQD